MFKTSVSKLLLTMVGIAVLALMVTALLRLNDAWTRYQDVRVAQTYVDADSILFRNMLVLRVQRGHGQTALLSLDDPVRGSMTCASRPKASMRPSWRP
ncbi:hypothetical protein ACFQ4K_17565 [Tistrella bauzanensis]